jgi:hypothetical protein
MLSRIFIGSQKGITMQLLQKELEPVVRALRLSQCLRSFPTEVLDVVLFPLLINDRNTNQASSNEKVFPRKPSAQSLSLVERLIRIDKRPFLTQFNDFSVARLLCSADDDIGVVEVLSQNMRQRPWALTLPPHYLLDDLPLTLYHILMSDIVFQSAFEYLVSGMLHKLLLRGCELFGVVLSANSDQVSANDNKKTVSAQALNLAHSGFSTDTTHQLFSEMTFNHIIIPLVWSLGSNSSIVQEKAEKGLTIICFLSLRGVWELSENDLKALKKMPIIDRNRETLAATSNVLSKCFIFVLSYLLHHEWQEQSSLQKCQSLRALQRLCKLLLPNALVQFLPMVSPMSQ